MKWYPVLKILIFPVTKIDFNGCFTDKWRNKVRKLESSITKNMYQIILKKMPLKKKLVLQKLYHPIVFSFPTFERGSEWVEKKETSSSTLSVYGYISRRKIKCFDKISSHKWIYDEVWYIYYTFSLFNTTLSKKLLRWSRF